MRNLRTLLISLILVASVAALSGAALPRLHAPIHRAFASSNTCQQSYNWTAHVGNLWLLMGASTYDTSAGAEIIPVEIINADSTDHEFHPEVQFQFKDNNGTLYPRAFGVPALLIKHGFSACFTLGYKLVSGGSGTTQCPFLNAILTFFLDLNHQQPGYGWWLDWAPC